MASPYVEFYGTLPDGTAGPALVYGFASGGVINVVGVDNSATNTITYPTATGTVALLTGINQTWGTYTQDFTAGVVKVPTMPFGTATTDAASTAFVLTAVSAIGTIHAMCQVASQTNITISAPGALIDGYAPAALDRILLVGQSTASENGPWLWNGAAVPLTRPVDWPTGQTDIAMYGIGFDVLHGNINAGTFWYVSTLGTIIIDTTSVTFSKFAWNISDGFALTNTGITLASIAAQTTNGTVWTDSTQKALATYQNGLGGTVPQTIFTQTADATISSTVTPATILGTGIGTKTLPADWAVIGKQIMIVLDGYYTCAGTPAATLVFKLGSTTIATGTIANAPNATNGKVSGEFLLTFRTIGATGTVSAGGVLRFTATTGASTSIPVVSTAATTIDTTASQAIDLVFNWGTAGSNVITVQQSRLITGN